MHAHHSTSCLSATRQAGMWGERRGDPRSFMAILVTLLYPEIVDQKKTFWAHYLIVVVSQFEYDFR
jgi:hypothetical protein